MLLLFIHHIELLFLYCSVLTCNLPLVFLFFSFSSMSVFLLFSIMSRKTRANRKSTSTSSPTFDSERFLSEKNQEAYEKLNLCRNI